ncbi:MAG: hypothetical protein RJB39_28 [Candidatus Parcubacteria bacterium]|jgi:prepilin-type N-terminal cleavage/methylation domain-containing protein
MMKLKNRSNQQGFTLIELLVVIAIIGLLTSIVSASLSTARAKARDAKRQAEVHSIEKALSLYSIDHRGYLPNSQFHTWDDAKLPSGQLDCLGAVKTNNDTLFGILVSQKYLASAPSPDPLAGQGYCYVYITDAGQSVGQGAEGNMVAGAVFDLEGQSYVGEPIYLAATEVTKSPNAVFAFPRETQKTFSGYTSVEGISVGTTPPVSLNNNYTTGVIDDTNALGPTGY